MSNEVQQGKVAKLGTCPICNREGSFGQSQVHEKLWVCFSPDHPAWAGSYFMGAMHGAWAELTSVIDARTPRELDLSDLDYPAAGQRDEQIYLESFGYPEFEVPGGELLRRIWRHQVHRAMRLGLTLPKAKRHADAYIRLHLGLESIAPVPRKAANISPDVQPPSEPKAVPKPIKQTKQTKPAKPKREGSKEVSKRPRILTNVQ